MNTKPTKSLSNHSRQGVSITTPHIDHSSTAHCLHSNLEPDEVSNERYDAMRLHRNGFSTTVATRRTTIMSLVFIDLHYETLLWT